MKAASGSIGSEKAIVISVGASASEAFGVGVAWISSACADVVDGARSATTVARSTAHGERGRERQAMGEDIGSGPPRARHGLADGGDVSIRTLTGQRTR